MRAGGDPHGSSGILQAHQEAADALVAFLGGLLLGRLDWERVAFSRDNAYFLTRGTVRVHDLDPVR